MDTTEQPPRPLHTDDPFEAVSRQWATPCFTDAGPDSPETGLPALRLDARPSLPALGGLLRAIERYSGTAIVSAALRLEPLVLQPASALRQAEWTEFDLEAGIWSLPATRRWRSTGAIDGAVALCHRVPLSRQAVAILRKLSRCTGHRRLVFPSLRGGDRPISEMALSAALKRMGPEACTALREGWCAVGRVLAVEALGVRPEVVGLQLSRATADSLGPGCHDPGGFAERRELMQRWADYLDELKSGPTTPSPADRVDRAPSCERLRAPAPRPARPDMQIDAV